MKKLHLYALALLVSGSMFFTACNDDTDPDGGDTTSCKITTVTDSDGEVTTYTWDGDQLVKITIKDSTDTYITNFTYANGKLTRVEQDQNTTFEIIYTGDDVTRVNERDYLDNELYNYYTYTYSGGNLSRLDVYEVNEAPESDSLIEQYDLTFNGDNLSKVDMKELGDGGKLESLGSIQVTSTDDKMNPFYMMPTLFSDDYDDFSVLGKNNITAMSLVTPFGPLPFAISYEYNAEGYPVKVTTSALGETDESNATYDCK